MKINELPENFDISQVRIFIPKGINVQRLETGQTAYIRGYTTGNCFLSKQPGGKSGRIYPVLNEFFDIEVLLNAEISFIPKKLRIKYNLNQK